MTWPRYDAICKQWGRVPPLPVSAALIAQALDAWKPAAAPAPAPAATGDDAANAANFQALIDLFGGVDGLSVTKTRRHDG